MKIPYSGNASLHGNGFRNVEDIINLYMCVFVCDGLGEDLDPDCEISSFLFQFPRFGTKKMSTKRRPEEEKSRFISEFGLG
jgi:hypothetical protein